MSFPFVHQKMGHSLCLEALNDILNIKLSESPDKSEPPGEFPQILKIFKHGQCLDNSSTYKILTIPRKTASI